MTEIYKQWKKIKEGVSLTMEDWNVLETFIWKQQLKIEELTKSRDNWRKKYEELKT